MRTRELGDISEHRFEFAPMNLEYVSRALRASLILLTVFVAPSLAQPGPDFELGAPSSRIVAPEISSQTLSWSLVDASYRTVVSVTGPEGHSFIKVFEADESVELDLAELGEVPDGRYSYTVRTVPTVPGEDGVEGFTARYGSGAIRVSGGFIEPRSVPQLEPSLGSPKTGEEGGLQTKTSEAVVDVGGSPYLQLEDTTPAGAETEDDWWLYADRPFAGDGDQDLAIIWQNDAPGGTNTNAVVIGNDINEDALYLRSRGNTSTTEIGVNTGSPSATLHLASDAIPDIRFEDVGGTPYSWEVEADAISFSVQDVTAGTFPLVVEAGAPSDSLTVDSAGSIGLGTATPSSTMEIEGLSGTAQFLIDERAADANVEVMFNLVCNCSPGFRMQNTVNGETWFFRHTSAGDFSFDNVGGAGLEARLDSSGNFFILGSLSQGSSRGLKENLEPVDGRKVLDSLDGMELYEWSYIDQGARHFGPMAEEFSTTFGLGESKTKIAPADMAGVALAGVKELRDRNASLEERVKKLEALLMAKMAEDNR